MNKREFTIIDDGAKYAIPTYQVVPGVGIEKINFEIDLRFVVGSKIDGENTTPAQHGTLHEHLMAVMIHDLKAKNAKVPNRYTSMAITNLEQALWACEERAREREQNGKQGTYQK